MEHQRKYVTRWKDGRDSFWEGKGGTGGEVEGMGRGSGGPHERNGSWWGEEEVYNARERGTLMSAGRENKE